MRVSGTGVLALTALIAAAAAAVWIHVNKREISAAVSSAVDSVVDAVNPTSSTNLAYRGANGLAQAFSGREDETFGGWLAELLSPIVRDANAMVKGTLPPPPAPPVYGLNTGGTFVEGMPL